MKDLTIPEGVNLNDLPKMAQANPRYAAMLGALFNIDKFIKKVVRDEVEAKVDNPDAFFVKTELMAQCYCLYLFSNERQLTVGHMWPLVDFLALCEAKQIEFDIKTQVTKMIKRMDLGDKPTDKVIWIQ